jgi:hypothetical protein
LAKLPKLEGGCWHPYRRKWATERKHHPIQDVMHAGGWKTASVVQDIYQAADTATVYRVLTDPGEVREAAQ